MQAQSRALLIAARPIDPAEIRHELGITGPPHRHAMIADLAAYFAVKVRRDDRVSGALTTWRPEGCTVTLGRLPTMEALREHGAHEFGHIARGHLGPERPVVYSRGSKRGAYLIPTYLEDDANEWALDWMIGQGPLGIALNHDRIVGLQQLARHFWVNPRTIMRAARRYGLAHLVMRDPGSLERLYKSEAWRSFTREILRSRPVCERRTCGSPSQVAHHMRYDRCQLLLPDDVEALCWPCHHERHRSSVSAGQLQLRLAA